MSEQNEAVASVLRRAGELIATGQWHYAVEILEGELERHPDDVRLLVSLARTYRDVKRHQDALRLLAMARALSPDDREVLLQLGIVYREAADLSGALNAHERLVALYPNDGEASRQYALTLVAYGKPDDGLRVLAALVAREPDELAHRTAVGRALLALGRYREAVRVLVAVVDGDPDLLWGWITLAETYRQQRRMPEWKHAVVRAGTLNAEHPAVLVQTGDVAAVLERDPVRAISNYERALTANPRWFPAHIALGLLAWQGRRLDVAEHHLTRAVDIAPWSGLALGVLARFRGETGRGEVALDALEQEAHELPYGGLAAHLGRVCYAAFDDNDRAVRLLEIATEASPEDAETHHDLARAYHAVGRYDDAVRAARRAVALSPDLAEAWILLGRCCVVLERHPEAIEALERGLVRFPDDPMARGSYAIALAGAGDPRRAIAEYEKALAVVPEEGSLLYNLASTLYDIGDIEHARPVAERARQHLPPDEPHLTELLRLLDEAAPR